MSPNNMLSWMVSHAKLFIQRLDFLPNDVKTQILYNIARIVMLKFLTFVPQGGGPRNRIEPNEGFRVSRGGALRIKWPASLSRSKPIFSHSLKSLFPEPVKQNSCQPAIFYKAASQSQSLSTCNARATP